MRKISIYVEAEVDAALQRRAELEGTTEAALIQDALRLAAAGRTRIKPRSRGVFEAPSDLAEDVGTHLRTSGFGEA